MIRKVYRRVKSEYGYWKNRFKDIEKVISDNRPFTRIITYHAVALNDNLILNSRFIAKEKFEEQLKMFNDHFRIISMQDLFEENYNPDDPNLAISFDDGYKSNFELVLPILEKYKVPATFYISTIGVTNIHFLWTDILDLAFYLDKSGIVVNGKRFKFKSNELLQLLGSMDDDERKVLLTSLPLFSKLINNSDLAGYWQLLDKTEIRELSNSHYVTIGSHTINHLYLDLISETRLKDELLLSKQYLEKIIGKEVIDLAFPFGTFSDSVVKASLDMGYNRLVSVDPHLSVKNETKFMKSRMTNNPHINSRNQVICIANGCY